MQMSIIPLEEAAVKGKRMPQCAKLSCYVIHGQGGGEAGRGGAKEKR